MRLAPVVRWSARAVVSLLLAMVVAVPPPAAGESPGAGSGRDEKFGQWTAEWWQWVLSLPVSDNPLFDETGERAATAQPNKKVFYLVGVVNLSGTAERTITIPEGTPLFGPVVNSENDNVFNDPPLTVPVLRQQVTDLIDTSSGFLILDGQEMTADLVHRVQSPVFSYVLPAEDNIYQFFGVDVSGRIKPAISDGYWFYIPPLSRGEHTLHFHGVIPGSLELDIIYHINVVPPGGH